MRQCVKYSLGALPTLCLKSCAKAVRDIPAAWAKAARVHARAGSRWMKERAARKRTSAKRGEPSWILFNAADRMQAECFDKHRVGNLLGDHGATWLWVTHFAEQPIHCPAKRFPLCLAFQPDYRRQNIQ